MHRLLFVSLLVSCTLCAGVSPSRAADDDSKAALQAFNEYIGDWKGSGGPERPRPDARDGWSEKLSWGWRFKGDDAWLRLQIQNGRHWQGGDLRFLPDKKVYQFTAETKDGKQAVFAGTIQKGYLVLERTDPQTKDLQQLRMNTAAEGARFVYRVARKPEGRTLFTPEYQVACTKEGESLGVREKKVECVVSGGLGTIAVVFKGTTYYVCCSGCRDAFVENPEKYIKEAEERKRKK